MTYKDFKNLPRRAAADKVLHDKAFNIDKNPKYDGYQPGLASKVYTFLDKKTSGGTVKCEIMPHQSLAEELHKPIIRKFEKRKVHSSFIDNTWHVDLHVDLAEILLINNLIKDLNLYYVL